MARPRPASLRTPRGALVLTLVVALALAVVDVLIAVRFQEDAARENGHVSRAEHSVGRMFSVVHTAEESAYAPDPAETPANVVNTARADQVRTLAQEIAADAEAVSLRADATALSAALDTWLADPASSMHPVLIAADALSADLDLKQAAQQEKALAAQNTLFLLHGACLLALLGLLGAVTWTVWRRIVTPLAALEGHLARTTADPTAAATVPQHARWLGGVWGEAEHALLLLKDSTRRATRADEALRTDAATSYGLQRILAVQDRPNPGVTARTAGLAAEGVVAGDFVEVLPLPDGRTALLQGDVSGHGIHAGLLAAQVKSAAVAALRLGRPPTAAAEAAWSVLTHEDERFTTLAVAVLDPAAHRLTWLNAGHEIVLLRRADHTVHALEPTGPVVGSFLPDPERAWHTRTAPFAPGDLLLLATDGLTEARDPDGTMLGRDAVTALLTRAPAEPDAALRSLHRAVEQHGTDWNRDDITLLAAALTRP
ncbi:serine/threonine-protein phosphatase [Kitasatospora sp. NA04385]|uniref:PP2C family protein-serine/threonine phosphatase n=1 Tax=Kitasatospora sp. NA04385 TaxID=2742135 RepID=UPI00159086AF|nr:PP2C family protein-serine/threonine phosphatase [Kitasatospora sp. NA04385]QKW18527.1 serine/threonine-protein phosphatase [Kitasatospora sp. NA04385]